MLDQTLLQLDREGICEKEDSERSEGDDYFKFYVYEKGAINRGTAIRGNMGINRLLRLFKTSETSYISLKCGNYCE